MIVIARRLCQVAAFVATLVCLSSGPALATTVTNPPSISAAFSQPTVLVGQTGMLTFTITNPNAASALTGVGFSAVLPAGLTATVPADTCNGALGVGGGVIFLSGGVLPPGASCTATVNVVASIAVTFNITTNAVTSNEGGSGNTASAALTANPAPLSISEAFGAASIPLNGTTSLTFTITNPAASVQTNAAFTDTLPAGLVITGTFSNSCGGTVVITTTGSIALSNVTPAGSSSCTLSFNVTGTSAGTKINTTGAISSFEGGTGNSATATLIVGAPTSVALASSLNPSQVGQSVAFTATVTSNIGTPTGSVTFMDGAVALSTVTLSAGIASFTTTALTLGNHSITAAYAGSGSIAAATSAVLTQVVNVPADSLKLRAMQALAAPTVAQTSGQAMAGAIDSAIGEAFSPGGGTFATPNASGIRFNFAADPEAAPARIPTATAQNPFASVGASPLSLNTSPGSPGPQTAGTAPTRFDDDFSALAYAAPTKAPPLAYKPLPDWFGWAEVRGAVLDHWTAPSLGTPGGVANLYGDQVNLLAGLTRKVTSNFVVGVLGGYETFDYRSDALQGRLKGDGWTVGSYLGWLVTTNIRFTAGIAYSGIGYDDTAGTAAGNFDGHRLLASGGFTGTYQTFGVQLEPSARLYALWEHEDAYTDTLGTQQAAANFFTGRASAGAKVSYPFAWSPTAQIAPYAGLYSDYYFNSTDASAVLAAASAIPPVFVFDGWSARAIGGVAAQFANGAVVAVGGERGGIGGGFALWTYRARASIPIVAQ